MVDDTAPATASGHPRPGTGGAHVETAGETTRSRHDWQSQIRYRAPDTQREILVGGSSDGSRRDNA